MLKTRTILKLSYLGKILNDAVYSVDTSFVRMYAEFFVRWGRIY